MSRPEGGGLDAGTGAPRLRPGLGPIHRLGIAAQHGRLRERTAGANMLFVHCVEVAWEAGMTNRAERREEIKLILEYFKVAASFGVVGTIVFAALQWQQGNKAVE